MDNVPNTPAGNAKVYEMQWDCKFCSTKKLLGKTHRFCPNCGAQQDPAWRYFPSDAEKVAVQDHVYVGADRVCPACQSLSSGNAEFCGNCGAPLTDAARAKQGASRAKKDGATFETEDLQKRQQGETSPAPTPAPRSKGLSLPCLLLIILVPLLIGGGIFLFSRSTTANAYVSGFRWERSVRIESLQPVSDSSDCGVVPIDAYNVVERYEQVGSRQVPDGQTCERVQIDQGDGTFREEQRCETVYRDEPVYGYVCYYVVNRWAYARSVNASGNKDTQPYWPSDGAQSCLSLGCERVQGRDEAYWLVLKGDGDRPFECRVPYDQWQETAVEKTFTIEVGQVLKDFRCDTLKPAG
jgi:hypothetical protein